jgi:UDPglucose 6-dehydrogenase
MNTTFEINFIGLGKLGLPLATCFAKNSIKVNAVDINKKHISNLKSSIVPWYENSLETNLKLAYKNINYFSNVNEITDFYDTTIVLLSTPSLDDGSFSNEYIFNALEDICKHINKHNFEKHHFILSSTVMPGTIENEFIKFIESKTNLRSSTGSLLFSYVPDFVAIGEVIKHFENPDFLLVGGNEQSVIKSKELYKCILKNNPMIMELNLLEAEIAKVSLNAYITTKISFANYIKVLSNRVAISTGKKINPKKITSAIGLDKRIGLKYFNPGGSYGGTCFPRDTHAMIKFSNNFDLEADQMLANEKINDLTDKIIFDKIESFENGTVGLLGLAFKPNTSVVTEGLAKKILDKYYHNKSYNFIGFDFIKDSFKNLKLDYNYDIKSVEINELIEKCDIIIECNPENYNINSNKLFKVW